MRMREVEKECVEDEKKVKASRRVTAIKTLNRGLQQLTMEAAAIKFLNFVLVFSFY